MHSDEDLVRKFKKALTQACGITRTWDGVPCTWETAEPFECEFSARKMSLAVYYYRFLCERSAGVVEWARELRNTVCEDKEIIETALFDFFEKCFHSGEILLWPDPSPPHFSVKLFEMVPVTKVYLEGLQSLFDELQGPLKELQSLFEELQRLSKKGRQSGPEFPDASALQGLIGAAECCRGAVFSLKPAYQFLLKEGVISRVQFEQHLTLAYEAEFEQVRTMLNSYAADYPFVHYPQAETEHLCAGREKFFQCLYRFFQSLRCGFRFSCCQVTDARFFAQHETSASRMLALLGEISEKLSASCYVLPSSHGRHSLA